MFEPGKLNHLLEQAKPEASPYTLESLEAWLVKQDPAGRYDFCDCKGRCLISLYAYAVGDDGNQYCAAVDRFMAINGSNEWGLGVVNDIAVSEPWVFGDALLRTRAAIAARTSP